MSIMNKPDSGSWSFSTGTFGVNDCPAPDSLFMMEETSGAIVNSGKDIGSYDSGTVTADYTGLAANGDSYLAFTAANSDTVEWASVFGITSYPFTLACIYRGSTNATAEEGMFGVADGTATNVYYMASRASNEQARISAKNTTALNASTGTAMDSSVWRLVVAVFASATDRRIYQDGGFTTQDLNSVLLGSLTQARLGARPDSTPSNYLQGDIAAAMIWKDTALSAAQVQTDLYNAGDPWGFMSAGGAGSSAITNVGVQDLNVIFDNELRVIITGSDFEAVQGTGLVKLYNTDPLTTTPTVTVAQTVRTWADTSISIDVDKGALTGENIWIGMDNDTGSASSKLIKVKDDPGTGAIGIRVETTLNENITDGGALNVDYSPYFFASDVQDALTFSAVVLPTGLSCSAAGLISGTIADGAHTSSPYSTIITCTDLDGNDADDPVTWTVTAQVPDPVPSTNKRDNSRRPLGRCFIGRY